MDPTLLLLPDHMSDDTSGPEDGEDATAWKRRMAELAGFGPNVDLEKMTVWENIKPNFRSDEVRTGNDAPVIHVRSDASQLTLVLRRLWELYWQTVTQKQARGMAVRVRDTGRSSNRVPAYVPFNFGINRAWYDEFKDKDTHRLFLQHSGWLMFEDPPGFGANTGGGEDNTVEGGEGNSNEGATTSGTGSGSSSL